MRFVFYDNLTSGISGLVSHHRDLISNACVISSTYCSSREAVECMRCTIWPYVTIWEYVETSSMFPPGGINIFREVSYTTLILLYILHHVYKYPSCHAKMSTPLQTHPGPAHHTRVSMKQCPQRGLLQLARPIILHIGALYCLHVFLRARCLTSGLHSSPAHSKRPPRMAVF